MADLGVGEVIAIVGLAATATTTAYSAAAQKQQAGYQVAVENENRKTGLLAAADAVHRGDIAEQNARTRTRLLIAQQRAGYAASGVEVGSGSPLATTADTAMFGELDALTIKNNAQQEAWGYLAQSEDFKRKSQLIKAAAKNNTGSTLLTGGSQALNQYSAGLQSGVF